MKELIETIEELLSELADNYPADYNEIARGIAYYEKSLAQVTGRLVSHPWPITMLFVSVLVDEGRDA